MYLYAPQPLVDTIPTNMHLYYTAFKNLYNYHYVCWNCVIYWLWCIYINGVSLVSISLTGQFNLLS